MIEQSRCLPGFIVFESIDGAGTTTQIRLLAEKLAAAGVPCRRDAEPTSGPIGQLIRQALSGHLPLHAATVAYLFAADRAEHVEGSSGIRANCAAGRLVLSDRYLFSSLAYQGLTCGRSLPERLNQDFPLPELLFFFHLPAETGMDRMKDRTSLEIYEQLDFQRQVAAAYEEVMERFRDSGLRLCRIDASQSIEQISATIWQEIERLLAARSGG